MNKISKEEICKKLLDRFQIIVGNRIDFSKVQMNTKLKEELGFTSVEMIYFAITIEELFDINMDDVSFNDFVSISDVVDYISDKI